jgi:hypothetical protein
VVTDKDLNKLADAWIRHWHAPKDSDEREKTAWASGEVIELPYDGKSEELWQIILNVHERDQSITIRQVLSAGPIEDLLSHFGELYIERVEEKARQDPAFAKVLGGVWQNRMSDEVWQRLQAVWDRRGWDEIPE